MSPEKQRIAIAEACGWKRHTETEEGFGGPLTYRDTHSWKNSSDIFFRRLPDYLCDLNEMREAEEMLNNSKDSMVYMRWLHQIVFGYGGIGDSFAMNLWAQMRLSRATAAQRAEAFLRTIGKWEDS